MWLHLTAKDTGKLNPWWAVTSQQEFCTTEWKTVIQWTAQHLCHTYLPSFYIFWAPRGVFYKFVNWLITFKHLKISPKQIFIIPSSLGKKIRWSIIFSDSFQRLYQITVIPCFISNKSFKPTGHNADSILDQVYSSQYL